MAKLTLDPSDTSTDTQELLGMYRLMVRVRRFEESLYRRYREGKIGGYLHRYDGEEALVAGVVPLLRRDDYILCTYRDHGHAISCGVPMREVMAELYGRVGGCAAGKGGSMHLIGPEYGFLGGDGIVGGPVPVALGVGYAIKMRGGDQVCACYFGDGAINQGGVHESMNMAALYGVPVLFILENNGYAMGTAVERSTRQPDMVAKAAAHGIAGEQIDAMDAQVVREAASRIIGSMRATHEPYFLEARCYRYVGHGVADNAQQQRFYREEDEIEQWKRRDPLLSTRARLVELGALGEADEKALEAEVEAEIAEAVAFAEQSPEPPLDSLYENVFTESMGV
jgi:pyruvate dehydrogenase E1 component alpha subunit